MCPVSSDTPAAASAWDWIYATREMTGVGWYEPDPFNSRELVAAAIERGARSLIDVGGGASWLVDHLLELDLDRIAVLDISEAALGLARHRLGDRAERIEWIVGDASVLEDVGTFDIWHDRAAFHFLLDPDARRRYADLARQTVPEGGTVIVATFADDGPERCSGMPVQRYEPGALAAELGDGFQLVDSRRHLHHTPAGVAQQFQYSTFRRVAREQA
jgi:SAM-dependent methyltransferase